MNNITNSRINNAKKYDQELRNVDQIKLIKRINGLKEVFHLYTFIAENRDELADYLKKRGVDAKVHYPIPMHLQPAAAKYGYKNGDFPIAEKLSNSCISLPVHEFIKNEQITYTSNLIKSFYMNT